MEQKMEGEESNDRPNQIYVSKLDRRTTQDDLRQAFEKFGTVKSCEVKHNKYAFIDFEEADAVEKAIGEMDGAKFVNGEVLVV